MRTLCAIAVRSTSAQALHIVSGDKSTISDLLFAGCASMIIRHTLHTRPGALGYDACTRETASVRSDPAIDPILQPADGWNRIKLCEPAPTRQLAQHTVGGRRACIAAVS